MPRLWVANAEEALPGDDLFYEQFFAAKTMRMFPRFLLCLKPGDCLVVPAPIPEDFANYIARLLRLGDPEGLLLRVKTLSSPYTLVESILQDEQVVDAIRERCGQGDWVMEPFIETPRIMRLANVSGIPTSKTSPLLVWFGLVGRLNDKGAFKKFASALGVRTVPGLEVDCARDLERAIQRMAVGRRELMLRKVSYAGGAGNMHGSPSELLARLPDWYNGGRILVEPFLDIASVAGSLASIGPDSLQFLGIDLQVIRDGGWAGFDFPYPAGPGASLVRDWTMRIAEAVRDAGARGYLNLDWAFLQGSPGSPVVLECNFRHNGLAYVTEFAGTYFGKGWDRLAICSREGLPTSAQSTEELLARLSGLRLDGQPVLIQAPGAARGAVLTAPPEGGAYSVAVFAEDGDLAARALALVEEVA